jgi:hypothetical protein
VGLLSAAAFSLAACSDSLHLDPPARPVDATGAGGAGTGGAGAGGEATVACVSNSDCPAPTAVCDVVKQACVECLEINDCGFRPGTVCSEGSCVCPKAGDSFCGAVSGLAARCVNLVTSTTDCGSCNQACFGACNNGKCADAWEPTATADAPSGRREHAAVWTDAAMIVWGGFDGGSYLRTGGIYDPNARTWTPTSTANAPGGRSMARAVWTGSKMIVWGGYNAGAQSSGGVFDPATNTWQTVSAKDAPSARYGHTAVWTGSKMVVWGGTDGNQNLQTGGIYDPMTDTWTPTAVGPTQRQFHTAVWTGMQMIIFGGYGFDGATDNVFLSTGGVFDPGANAWAPLQTLDQPPPRMHHTAVWTGSAMLIWGGEVAPSAFTADGSKFSVAEDGWLSFNGTPPEARRSHTAVWLGDRMYVWGGNGNSGVLNSGGIYNPMSNAWETKNLPTALSARTLHTAVVAGSKMIIWGGDVGNGVTNTGGVFDPAFTP